MKSPELISTETIVDGHELTLELHIPKDCVFFNGHFPGNPILPGVVQVNWAINFAAKLLGVNKESITEIAQLKFTQVILPNTHLYLSLTLENNQLAFRYFNPECVYSFGKIKVGS